MVERGRAHDVNEAARRFAETLAESYRVVYGQAAESQERQRRLAQGFSELVATNLREQTEGGRAAAERLSEQANKQQEAGQASARESVEAYEELLLLRDYEERNKRRDTLLEQMDRKIRAT